MAPAWTWLIPLERGDVPAVSRPNCRMKGRDVESGAVTVANAP